MKRGDNELIYTPTAIQVAADPAVSKIIAVNPVGLIKPTPAEVALEVKTTEKGELVKGTAKVTGFVNGTAIDPHCNKIPPGKNV